MLSFTGEPEIAKGAEEQYEETNIVNHSPHYCNGRLWAVIATNHTQQHQDEGGNENNKNNINGTSTSTNFCLAAQQNDDDGDNINTSTGGFLEITSFPPSLSSSSSSSNQQQQPFFVCHRVSSSGSGTRTSNTNNNTSSAGGGRNFILAIRQSDGVFVVADADSLCAIGMCALTDEDGNSVEVSCVVPDVDHNTNRLFVFATKKNTSSSVSSTQQQQNTKQIENSIFSVELIEEETSTSSSSSSSSAVTEGGAKKVSVKILECLCFQTSSRLVAATLVPQLNAFVVAREGGIVELFSRSLIVKLLTGTSAPSSSSSASATKKDHHNNDKSNNHDDNDTLLLSRFVFSSHQQDHPQQQQWGQVTTFAFSDTATDTNTEYRNPYASLLHQLLQQQQQQNKNNTTTTTPDNNNTIITLPTKIFCCTSNGYVVVLSVILENNNNNNNNKIRLRFKKAHRIFTSSSHDKAITPTASLSSTMTTTTTSSSITSAVVACSTIWFSDVHANVRIWNIDPFEELGSLNATLPEEEKEAQQDHHQTPPLCTDGLVLELSQLEARKSLAVFKKPLMNSSNNKNNNNNSNICDIVSFIVKQDISPSASNINSFSSNNNNKTTLSQLQELISKLTTTTKQKNASNSNIVDDKNTTTANTVLSNNKEFVPTSPATAPPPQPQAANTIPQPQQRSSSSSSSSAPSTSTTTDKSMITFIQQLCNILTSNKKTDQSNKNNTNTPVDDSTTKNNNNQQPPCQVPLVILRAVPEAEYLEAALSSVSTCSSIIGQTLPNLNLRPSSLTQDVSIVCDIASRLYRNENRMKQVVSELEKEFVGSTTKNNNNTTATKMNDNDSSNETSEMSLRTLCQRIANQHETENDNLKKQVSALTDELKMLRQQQEIQDNNFERKNKEKLDDDDDHNDDRKVTTDKKSIELLQKEVLRMREENEKLQEELSLMKKTRLNSETFPSTSSSSTGTRSFSHQNIDEQDEYYKKEVSRRQQKDSVKKHSTINKNNNHETEEDDDKDKLIDKLQSELRSKSSLVKHLMQLTNDNGKVIDEMRQHSVRRRDECVELRQRIREVEDRHLFFIEASVKDIDRMLETFTSSHSTSTSNLRSVVFMLQNLKQKLIT